jgi:predicted DCC family thiol-disulfide oxidoreductase YuxK
MSSEAGPILLFDGVCNLCNGTVQFVIERDPKATVKFASLQSAFAAQQFQSLGIANDYLDSIVLLEEGKVFVKSTAAIRLSRHLSGLWPVLRLLLIIPRPIRDLVYDWVARNRYRWFGKQETCWIPTPELRARFVDV